MIERLLIVPLMLLPLLVNAGEVVEAKVKGMFCEMCAYGLQMNLNEIDGVKEAKVDYAGKSCRVEMKDGEIADLDLIKETIVNSGFSPRELKKVN